jgi:hypothetical protein
MLGAEGGTRMNSNRDTAAVGRYTVIAATILAGLSVSGPALGQQSESVTVDVGECVKLQSPGERLDCYEAQVQRAQQSQQAQPPAAPAPAASSPAPARAPTASPPPAVATAPAAPAPAASPPAAQPSRREVRVENARVANRGDSSAADGAAHTGTITALRERLPNSWLITLDNGQVWSQTYAKWYPLQVGQRVEIGPGSRLGTSYRLTAVGVGGNIQVERVR